MASSSRVVKSRISPGPGYRDAGSENSSVRTPCGSNPASTRCRFQKLLTSSPELTISRAANVTWEATSHPRARNAPDPAPSLRPPSLSAVPGCPLAICRAGARLKTVPASAATVAANPSTAPSIRISPSRGMSAGSTSESRSTPQTASPVPSNPPAAARMAPSSRRCRVTRHVEAPSATRIAISLRRAIVRAIARLATLAQATSSTRPTAPARSGARHAPGPPPRR